MALKLHRAEERGVAEHGWLHSRFSFSFADYFDRNRMGFGALRVINDDVIEAGQGFATHPHDNMEIITVVTGGALLHRDSEGHEGVVRAGEIQYMSAGSGIRHSEFASPEADTALFQIWIYPAARGGAPRYEQRDFNALFQSNRWTLLVSSDGREHSIRIKQEATIHLGHLEAGNTLLLPDTPPGLGHLLFVIEGELTLDGLTLGARDEVQIVDEEPYTLAASAASRVLLFSVPL